jgi:membrane-associated phospholipid phosphatase
MQPADLVTFVYAAVGAAVLALERPSPAWPILLTGHLVLLSSILRLRSSVGQSGWLRDWYPLLLVPLFYIEIRILNASRLSNARDDSIRLLEQLVFPFEPARTLAAALPYRALSEGLHLAYLSYYAVIYGPLLALYLQRRRDAFRDSALGITLTFYCCYLLYLLVPVRGPWDLLPVAQAPPDGPLRQLAVSILTAGSSVGAAFPSSHEAVAVAQALFALTYLPRAAPWIALLAAGMGVGAVYAGFHYAIDMVAGAALGSVVALATRGWLSRTFEHERAAVIAGGVRKSHRGRKSIPEIPQAAERPGRGAAVEADTDRIEGEVLVAIREVDCAIGGKKRGVAATGLPAERAAGDIDGPAVESADLKGREDPAMIEHRF